jgi:hypothetical protein
MRAICTKLAKPHEDGLFKAGKTPPRFLPFKPGGLFFILFFINKWLKDFLDLICGFE